MEAMAPEVRKAIEEGVRAAMAFLSGSENRISPGKTGWSLPAKAGKYGADYRGRALAAFGLLGALAPEDAVYFGCGQDAQGHALNGAGKYSMHFDKQQVPHVGAFWSLTLYDSQGYFTANALRRVALGDRDPLKFNADGSLDLYIQHESPGAEKENNWLPAPEGDFNLALRLYWPDERTLRGQWNPPAVDRVTAVIR
jgi:hypothetical protein